MATPTYELIASTTTVAPVLSITVSSIPSTYKDLVITLDVAATQYDSYLGLRFNSDTGTNYNYVGVGNGTSASGAQDTNQIQIYSHLTTTKGLYIINVNDYSATNKHKYTISQGGSSNSTYRTGYGAGRWASTSAINSVTLFGGQGLYFATGAKMQIFGIEG